MSGFRTALCVILLLPVVVLAWGEKGHLMVNRLAIEAASGDLPAFMKAAADQLTYNGYEPDRWREEGSSPLNAAQAPDHFFDSEMWGTISTIPADRYAFMNQLTGRNIALSKIGYLPYSIMENYGRLRNAFRNWRKAQTPKDREAAQANAVVYAGILGHYVADGTMPMHLTIHYNGWADGVPNPKNFTKDRMLHSRYEAAYVNAALDAAAVRTRVQKPKRQTDVFVAVKNHLELSFGELDMLYDLEKSGEFNPTAPRPRGTALIATQLARAATMLGNLWYTAWVESAEPVESR